MTITAQPCDTPHCPRLRAPRRYRCIPCANHKQRYGAYPDLTPTAAPHIPPARPHGPALEPEWLFTDALIQAVLDPRMEQLA